MTLYQIRPLTINELNALQEAVLDGALSDKINGIITQMNLNKDHVSIVNSLDGDLRSLRSGARALLEATPL